MEIQSTEVKQPNGLEKNNKDEIQTLLDDGITNKDENSQLEEERISTLLGKVIFFLSILPGSFSVILTGLMSMAMMTIGYQVAGKSGEEAEVAGFGLSIVICLINLEPFICGCTEKMTLDSSYAFGAGDYDMMKRSLVKFVICASFNAVAIYFGVVLQIKEILVFLNIDLPIAVSVGKILPGVYLIFLIYYFGFAIIEYCSAQGISIGFFYICLISSSISYPLIYYLCYKKDIGLDGCIIGRACYESLVLLMGIIYLSAQNKIGRFRFSIIKPAIAEIIPFYFTSLYYSMFYILENVGTEISVIMVTYLHSTTQINAYTMLTNVVYITFHMGKGLSAQGRSKINNTLGSKNVPLARKMYYVITTGIVTISLVTGLLIFTFSQTIASFYTSQNEVNVELSKLLDAYGLILISGYFMTPYIFTISRMVRISQLLLSLEVILLIVVQLVIDLLLFFYYPRVSGVHFLIVAMSLLITLHAIILIKVYSIDWSKIEVSE